MVIFKNWKADIIFSLFQTLLLIYLLLILVEQIWPTFVSAYLNLNYLLVAVLTSGILAIFSEQSKKEKDPPKKLDYLLAIFLGVVGTIIIKIKSAGLAWLSWVISIISGMLIILLSFMVLQEDE